MPAAVSSASVFAAANPVILYDSVMTFDICGSYDRVINVVGATGPNDIWNTLAFVSVELPGDGASVDIFSA